jgi:hypothetical protein
MDEEKKSSNSSVVVAFFLIILVGVGVYWYVANHSSSSTLPIESMRTFNVEYEVTGSAKSVSITMQNATGGTEQKSNEPLPFKSSFTAKNGTFVYISAQNDGESGNVTATIKVNGNVFQTSTSTGAYVIASASGSVQ